MVWWLGDLVHHVPDHVLLPQCLQTLRLWSRLHRLQLSVGELRYSIDSIPVNMVVCTCAWSAWLAFPSPAGCRQHPDRSVSQSG